MNDRALNYGVAPGGWILDPGTTTIGFRATALFGLKVKGRFTRHETSITVGDTPADASVVVTIWSDSVATGNKTRDKHLRANNVFDVARFPTIEFASTAITSTAAGIELAGHLRVRDVSRPVTLLARSVDVDGVQHFTGELIVSPREFGISRPGTGKPVTVSIGAVLAPA